MNGYRSASFVTVGDPGCKFIEVKCGIVENSFGRTQRDPVDRTGRRRGQAVQPRLKYAAKVSRSKIFNGIRILSWRGIGHASDTVCQQLVTQFAKLERPFRKRSDDVGTQKAAVGVIGHTDVHECRRVEHPHCAASVLNAHGYAGNQVVQQAAGQRAGSCVVVPTARIQPSSSGRARDSAVASPVSPTTCRGPSGKDPRAAAAERMCT